MSVETVTRKSGKRVYRVRWRDGPRNRAKSFDRKKDAETFDLERRRLQQAGGLDIFARGEQTLESYAGEWWERYAVEHLGERTQDVYEIQLEKRIMPALAGYQLRQITPAVIERWMAAMRKDGAGDPTIIKSLTVLQAILKRAVIDGAIRSNPVADVRKPSQRRTRDPYLISPQQVEAIRRVLLADGRDGAATLVSLLAYAGLRPESEAITLPWDRVRARSILTRDTKRGRERSVRLLAPLAEDLAAWRPSSTGKLVVPARDGGDWTKQEWVYWLRHVFRPAAIHAGLPADVRPRDLRGSFATLLIFEGRNIVEVAAQLGHSAEVALRDYLQVIDEYDPSKHVSAEDQIRAARDF